jgi:anti-sigma regulatory factor (Ser/Thr protein kinase)
MSDDGQAHSGTGAESAVLEREFDAATLAGLRDAVLAFAGARGMSRGQATDVMLAVHELAANAVRHGPGHGRLRMRVAASTLRCEVSDPGQASAGPWEVKQGHGLWLAGKTADHMSVTSGPEGSRITLRFALTG